MIRVLLFEDNTDLVESIRELFAATDDIRLVAHHGNAEKAAHQVRYHRPDVVLMDIDMPVHNGLEGLRDIRASGNTTTVLMLTVMDDNDHVFQAICEGASGYLLKQASPAKILDAVREASTGGAPMSPSIATKVLGLFSQQFKRTEETEPLTEREKDVLARLVDGHSYKTAAAELGMGIETLRYHIKNIYSKLHVNSKSEAVLKATRNRMI